jgi:hypothetical protein
MPTRNTPVLELIVKALGESAPHDALAKLEAHFHDQLLMIVGDSAHVADFAEQLRLAITTPEISTVLDHIAREGTIGMSIDHVEDAINTLFPDRFIEP